jgi:hypothetical protein
MISEGPWLFVGLPDAVKVSDILQNCALFTVSKVAAT